jgi:hypothetical protein
MRYPRVLLITAVALILSGCLTIGPRYEEHIASSGAPAPGKGRVYVYRPGLLPLFGLGGISVNEVQLPVVLGARGFIVMDPPARDIQFRTYSGAYVYFVLKEGETRYIRIATSYGLLTSGRMYPELVEASTGRSEIEGLRLAAEFWLTTE